MCSRQLSDDIGQSVGAGPAMQYPQTIGAGAQGEGRTSVIPATVAILSNAHRTDVVVSRDGLSDVVSISRRASVRQRGSASPLEDIAERIGQFPSALL